MIGLGSDKKEFSFIFQCGLNVLVAHCCSKHAVVWIQIQLIFFLLGGTNFECQSLKYGLGGRGGSQITSWTNFPFSLLSDMITEHNCKECFNHFACLWRTPEMDSNQSGAVGGIIWGPFPESLTHLGPLEGQSIVFLKRHLKMAHFVSLSDRNYPASIIFSDNSLMNQCGKLSFWWRILNTGLSHTQPYS